MVHMTRLPPNPKRFIDAMVEEKNIVKLRFVIETSIMTCVYSKHVTVGFLTMDNQERQRHLQVVAHERLCLSCAIPGLEKFMTESLDC